MNELDLEQVVNDSNSRIAVDDLALLQRACDHCKAKLILEIGSADGGSSVVLARKAKERDGRLYCIEPRPRQRMLDNMIKYHVDNCYELIAKASPWVPSERVSHNLDLLFIDGCHELRWCLVDYHYWQPRIRPGGIIIFHDTSGQCQEDRRQLSYGKPGYLGLVRLAIKVILQTDKLILFDESGARNGGAMAFIKEC